MRILGIDPGYDRLGIAVIEKTAGKNGKSGSTNKELLLHSSCLQTSSNDTIYERFGQVGAEIARIMDEFKPDALAIETLFISKNQKTAMRVSEARGIIIYEAVKRGIQVHEYSPMEIKSAVTGDGTSDKTRMTKMVHLLITIPKKIAVDDEYDAIAVALTHSSRCRP